MSSRFPKIRLVVSSGVLCALLIIFTACGVDGRFSSIAGPDGRTIQFQSQGEASWYGPGFDGRQTASGEIFDSSQLTAAHGNLPFGTLLRVMNIETGESVVVRVNDRFPGTKGRIIDLSRASFAAIAPLARGVLTVRLEVVRSVK